MIQLLCLWTLVLFSTVAGGKAAVNSPIVTRAVEVHDAHDGFPSMLLGSSGAVSTQAGLRSSGVKFLVNSTANGHAKRHRQYVTPAGYNDTENGTLAETLNLPAERGGLKLSRWVICSWVVANISAADAVRNRDNVFLERIPELLRSVQNLAPSQVYAVAAANISLGFTLTGVSKGSITPAAEDALERAASDMAGGYSTHLIRVSTTPPDQATGGGLVAFEGAVQDTPPAPADVITRGKDLRQSEAAATGAAAAGRRRRLTGVQQRARLADYLVNAGGFAAAVLPRRLLVAPQAAATPAQAAPAAAAAPAVKAGAAAAASSQVDGVPMWLTYKHVAPANTTTLLLELCHSCNVTPSVAVGFDFAPQPCGMEVKAALVAAGVKVDEEAYSQVLAVPPSVSLSVRLAVGMTAAQVATGADVALAQWLAEPATAQAVARMYAPDAVIRWLHTPEIWFQKMAPQPAVSPGAAAGIAIAATVTVCAAVAAALWFFHPAGRKRKQAAAAEADEDDGNSTSSGRRRRRREGKRRYLLPDAPRPDSQPNGAAGAGPSSSAGPPSPEEEEDLDADDAELSLDQIRPQLRSLGDSVTSAVRYEQSDEEEEAGEGEAGPSAESAADSDSGSADPSTSHAASAAGALAAAGAAAAAAASSSRGAGTAGSSSKPAASSRSVLQAREALLSELRQQDRRQQDAAPQDQDQPSSSSRGHGGGSFAAWDVLPAVVSPELAAAADLSSAVSLPSRAQHSASPSGMKAAAGAAPADVTSAAASAEITPHLKPVDERAAAASAAAVAAAAALPQSGAVAASAQRRSPFAMSYDFGDLADTGTVPSTSPDPAAAAAAMAAASAKAVALPPRPLPVSPTAHRASCSPNLANGFERKSSGGGGSIGGGSSLASPAATGANTTSSSSASSPSSGAPAGTGSKGVGLQQLVSISPIRASSALGACRGVNEDASAVQDGRTVLTGSNMVSDGSMCSSVYLQGAPYTDSCESALMLSSSVSGPVVQPGTCTSQDSHSGGCSVGLPLSAPCSRQGRPNVEVLPAAPEAPVQQG